MTAPMKREIAKAVAAERERLAQMFLETRKVQRVDGMMSQYPTEWTEEQPIWRNGKEIAAAIRANAEHGRA